jgi:hypothetical protein
MTVLFFRPKPSPSAVVGPGLSNQRHQGSGPWAAEWAALGPTEPVTPDAVTQSRVVTSRDTETDLCNGFCELRIPLPASLRQQLQHPHPTC